MKSTLKTITIFAYVVLQWASVGSGNFAFSAPRQVQTLIDGATQVKNNPRVVSSVPGSCVQTGQLIYVQNAASGSNLYACNGTQYIPQPNVPAIQLKGAVAGSASQTTLRDFISVLDFGVVGDGTTDNTSGLQSAFTAACASGEALYLPAGNYYHSGQITFPCSSLSLFGESRQSAILTCGITTPTTFCYRYASAVSSAGVYDIDSSFAFSDFKAQCSPSGPCSLFQFNSPRLPSPPAGQGSLKGGVFRHVWLVGAYSSSLDPNFDTSTAPLRVDLESYGVAIDLNQTYGWTINDSSLLEHFGIAVEQISTDETLIDGIRADDNAVNTWIETPPLSYGNGNSIKILNSKFGHNHRLGSITINNAFQVWVTHNYFETYCPSSQFLRSTGGTSIGVHFTQNRIDDPNMPAYCNGINNTTPMVYFDDQYGDEFSGNTLVMGAAPPPMALQIGQTAFNASYGTKIRVFDNSTSFESPYNLFPDAPQVLYTVKEDPLLFRFDNIPGKMYGNATTVSPFWTLSPVTGHYVVNSTAESFLIQMPLPDPSCRRFSVAISARYLSGAGYQNVRYIEKTTNIHYPLRSAYAGISNASNLETIYYTLVLPDITGITGQGFLEFETDNQEIELESIRLLPLGSVFFQESPEGTVPAIAQGNYPNTFRIGDLVLNRASGAIQVVTAPGSVGIIANVTATTTAGTSIITVNSSASLSPRQWLSIEGVSGGPFQVININGASVKLSAPISVSVTSAPIQYAAPILSSFGNFISSGTIANSDLAGELTFSGSTTASYTFKVNYAVHPECWIRTQFNAVGNEPWVSYAGTTSFSIQFASAVSGAVSYGCIGRQ